MLRRLRAVQQNPAAVSWVDTLREGPTGLVLSGGGGKGAYEIGCLQALRRVGVKDFFAIAGTSVGALNAALVAQGGVEAGTKLWNRLRFSDVLKLHPIGFFVAIVGRILLAPMFLLRRVPSLWDAVSIETSAMEAGNPFGLWVAVFKTFLNFNWWFSELLSWGLPLLLFLAFLGWRQETERLWTIVKLLLYLFSGLGTWVMLWGFLHQVQDYLAEKFSLFSNEPLRRLVGAVVDPSAIRAAGCPTYVTVAALSSVETADVPPAGFSLRRWFFYGRSQKKKIVEYVPIYRDLRGLNDAALRSHLLQSAGIPEVFPRRALAGVPVVDGGIVDNSPILPVLQVREIRNVVVVYLERKRHEARFTADVPAALTELQQRISRVRILGDPENPIQVPESAPSGTEEPLWSGRKFLPLIPSRGLGGFISGTLNFTSFKARRLMWLGYWDTLAALERGLVSIPAPG